jgi:hypothetical protein
MANVENVVLNDNGYFRFILNDVDLLPNPRNGEKKNRNFSGELRTITNRDGTQFKTEERFANFVVPRDMEDAFMQNDIEMWQASEPDEDGHTTCFSKMKIKFNEYTKICLVEPKKRPVQLTEETVGILDGIRIRNADAELGRGGNPNRKGKYGLWVRTLYIYQDLPNDPFASKFAEFDEPQVDPLF